MQAEGGSSRAPFNREVNPFTAYSKVQAFHTVCAEASVNEACGGFRVRKGYDPRPRQRDMGGEVRKGERIPRREPPQFEEASNFAEAIARDGFIGTALDDKNQYGPVAMMVLLLIVAAITGTVIRLLG